MVLGNYAGRLGFAALVVTLFPLAACGESTDQGSAGTTTTSAASSASPSSAAASSTSAAPQASKDAACPLVDPAVVAQNYDVQNPQLNERDPVKTGPATTYACDVVDGGEPLLTAGFSVGPRSGTAEANLRAALSNVEGEPVDGLGEIGGYGETGGIGSAAGVMAVGDDQWLVVFVHGAAGNKDQLVAIAQDVAQKL